MTTGTKRVLRFLIPSLVGVFAFLYPVRDEGTYTIPMAMLSDGLAEWLGDSLPYIGFGLVAFSALVSLYFSWFRKASVATESRFMALFSVTRGWLFLRVAGAIVCGMIIWKLGPEFIWSEATGHIVVYDLLTAILLIFVFASFLLPLLTEFGLMELIGIALSRGFQFLFKLPGRSAIDALASWMSAGTVGILITSQQYESGYYSKREAAAIATNFSIVSLPFCVVVANFAGLGHVFIPYYITICVAGLVTAIVLPRIPPLSRIPDEYSEVGKQISEGDEPEGSLIRAGYEAALDKAAAAPGFKQYVNGALHNLFDIWFGLMPPLVAIATFGLVLAEYTPVFQILAYPFGVLLSWMQLPEAGTAAPAMLVGFAEMFLPAVIAQGIESEVTRFVVVAVSITQLIFMSENGVLILKTRIPLNLWNLFVLFLLRTIISLPIIAAMAHFFAARGILS